MKYTFSLDESDLLTHQLFLVSNSKPAIWRRRKTWLFTTITFMALASLFYQLSNKFLTNYFLRIGIICLIFYPLYSRWKYKRHYTRHIREHLSGSIDKQTTLEFQEDFVFGKDETNSESKVSYSLVESFNELPQHFLLKLRGGQALIIPKNKISDTEQLRSDILDVTKKMSKELKNYTNWKWR